MQEIAERMQRIEGLLAGQTERIQGVVDTLASFRQVLSAASRKEKNAVRRRHYREAKRRREEGRVALPEQHVLRFRDKRLRPRIQGWAEVGMKFGRADQPQEFLTWFVHQWNNLSYLRKPITFSGSSFRVWCTDVRFPYGANDLMHFVQRKGTLQLLRDDAQHDDFEKRPWWDWGYAVLYPVYLEMQALGFDDLPERFRRCVRLLLGGFAGHEVYTDLNWDFHESRANINKMLRRIGNDFQLMLQACWVGLRVKGEESPVAIP